MKKYYLKEDVNCSKPTLINIYNQSKQLIGQKLEIAFYDEYNEKRYMTPIRKLKIHKDKQGNKFIIHNHRRYLVEERDE